ncbi:RidA family protein [Streptomyces mirabilis]|uniref:RidA family protein n=1 Tax=Streptomyces mirabilis TaxID=68239 RepID=UPI00225BCFD8|nr:Rid family hydrolase [Streptomyces mirabilis]MCX4429129.1 Rid family hydrolase [Streptomyces mirabilis]MCX4429287.1 Rid family hydrolase [Streptomyces mirabilis]
MPWESLYGYSQAIQVGDAVYVSGQVSHDRDGNFVGAGDFELQVKTTLANGPGAEALRGRTQPNRGEHGAGEEPAGELRHDGTPSRRVLRGAPAHQHGHRDSSVDTPAFRRGRKRTPAEQGRESRFAARADRRPPPTTRRRLVVCRPSGR